jgi:hypothetical protein
MLLAEEIMGVVQRRATQPRFARMSSWAIVAGCVALSLVGCTSGTLSGMQQSCQSTFGLLDAKKVSCSGTVDTVSASPSLSVIEIGEELNGAFQLETTLGAGRGTAKAHVVDVDDRRVGGEISPGDPLRIVAVVYPEEIGGTDDEEETVEVQLEVPEGEELRDLRYEATLVAQED